MEDKKCDCKFTLYYDSMMNDMCEYMIIKSILDIPEMGIVKKEITWKFSCGLKIGLKTIKLKLSDESIAFLRNFEGIQFISIRRVGTEDSEPMVIKIGGSFFFYNIHESIELECTFLNKNIDFTASTITDDLKAFLQGGELSDVTFKCKGGEQLKAHKCLLAARSEYFKNMFQSPAGPRIHEIECEYSVEIMTNILNFIYTDQFDPKLSQELYPAANQFKIFPLKMHVLKSFSENIQPENAISTLIFAHHINEHSLKNFTLNYLCANLKSVSEANEPLELKTCPAEVLQLIIKVFAKSK